MTTYDRGDVIVVNVSFSDLSGFKPRPALVVSPASFHSSEPDLIICPISSQFRYFSEPGVGDLPIADWETVGLRHPSTVRIGKILSADKRIIKRALGRLSKRDRSRVDAVLRRALGLS